MKTISNSLHSSICSVLKAVVQMQGKDNKERNAIRKARLVLRRLVQDK